jgi:hypothetical protein
MGQGLYCRILKIMVLNGKPSILRANLRIRNGREVGSIVLAKIQYAAALRDILPSEEDEEPPRL